MSTIKRDAVGPVFVAEGQWVRPVDGCTAFETGSKLKTKRLGVQPTLYLVDGSEVWVGHDSKDEVTKAGTADAVLAAHVQRRVLAKAGK